MSVTPPVPSALFVCLGNICRSPLAEAAFRAEMEREHPNVKIDIDSAGTGDWHTGHPPDKRSRTIAKRHGISIDHYKARQVEQADFTRFTHIFAMDDSNLRNLQALAPKNSTAKLIMLLDLVPGSEGRSVADPYFGDLEDFEITWKDVADGAKFAVKEMFPSP